MSQIRPENLKSQKVAVLGLGVENVSLVKYLIKSGAEITVCDQKTEVDLQDYIAPLSDLKIEYCLGADYLNNLKDFKYIFRTPGISYEIKEIQEAKAAGVVISSVTDLFLNLTPCPVIGVTGTKGKGTTATLISEIFKEEFKDSKNIYLGGNIGISPIEFLENLTPEDLIVLELSSFQLQDLDKSPHIGVILNINQDHLDYHANQAEYVEAKSNILRYQKKEDFAVINADYLTSFEFGVLTPGEVFWFSRTKPVEGGSWVNNQGDIILRVGDKEETVLNISKIKLRGEHNLENVLAAIVASALAGAGTEAIKKVVSKFTGLPYRLEKIGTFQGVDYYNDSFSTTPETTMAALKSFSEPIILLVGGSEKGANYQALSELISKSNVKAVICIGKTGSVIISKINNPKIEKIIEIQSMEEAVKKASEIAESGDIVLLSPASASFDRYKNYKERGDLFTKKVQNL